MIIDENIYKRNGWNPGELVNIDEENTVNSYTVKLDFELNKSYKFEYSLNSVQSGETTSYIYIMPNNVSSAFWFVRPYWYGNGTASSSGNSAFSRPTNLYIQSLTNNPGRDPVPSSGEFIIDALETDYGYTLRGYNVRYGYNSDLLFADYGAIARLTELGGEMENLVFKGDGTGSGYPQWYGTIATSMLER